MTNSADHGPDEAADLMPWTNPAVVEIDQLDRELLRIAEALRVVRDLVGPTAAMDEVTAWVRWALREAQRLTPAQREDVGHFLEQGLSLPTAVSALIHGLRAEP